MTDQDQDIKSVRRWCGGGEVQNVDDAALRLCDEVEALRRKLELARGAIAAQDEREKMAGEACGVSWIEHGCDWPGRVAETVLTLRRRVAELEQVVERARDFDPQLIDGIEDRMAAEAAAAKHQGGD